MTGGGGGGGGGGESDHDHQQIYTIPIVGSYYQKIMKEHTCMYTSTI